MHLPRLRLAAWRRGCRPRDSRIRKPPCTFASTSSGATFTDSTFPRESLKAEPLFRDFTQSGIYAEDANLLLQTNHVFRWRVLSHGVVRVAMQCVDMS